MFLDRGKSPLFCYYQVMTTASKNTTKKNNFDIDIRLCRNKDINLLVSEMSQYGKSRFHIKRLQEQKDGLSDYLIAWHDGKPVGHILISWAGYNVELPSELQKVPELNSFEVAEKAQGKAVGYRMIKKAEALVKKRGFDRVGLLVNPNNKRAIALYERVGYKDSETGLHLFKWDTIDDHGKELKGSEKLLAYVKQLA